MAATDTGDRSADRFWWWLALVALVGLIVRVVYILVWRDDPNIAGDTRFYHEASILLADGKGFLNPFFSTPDAPYQSADHPPLYQVYLAGVSLLGVRTPLGHMLASALLGTATVVVAGLAGREIAGPRAGLIAAALAAVYANVWSWDGMILSETMALLTVTATLWLAYRFRHHPGYLSAALLGGVAALAALSRAELILLTVLVVTPMILVVRDVDLRSRFRRLVVAGLTAVVVLAPWVGYNMVRFEKPVYLSIGFEVTLASATCDETYYGDRIGYWSIHCVEPIRESLPAGLDQSQEGIYFRDAAGDYIAENRGQVPWVVLARWGRISHLYRPWQQATFDWFPEGRELWITRTGLVSFYLVAALAIAGGIVLRRRRVPVFPLLGPIVSVWITVTIAFASTRYRAAAETALVLLAAVAVDAIVRRVRAPAAVGERVGAPGG